MPNKTIPVLSKSTRSALWAVLFLFCVPGLLEAKKEQFRTVLSGTAIGGGANSLTTKDALFPHPAYNANWTTSTGIASQQASNYILFRLDPDNLDFPGCNFSATVTFDLQYLDASNISTTVSNISLTIEYNNDRGAIHRDQDYYTFQGGHWAQITNVKVTITPLSGTCTKAVHKIRLENVIDLERYYQFDANATGSFITCPPALNSANELVLSWNPIPGAEVYHLEWLFVNNYDLNTPVPSAGLRFNFRYNATRIETQNTSHKIPLLFEQGYIVFRYRGVGRGGANFDIPVAGAWTIPGEEQKDPAAFCHFLVQGANVHEGDTKNWQMVTNYAEGGKHKSVVSYFGGDLRSRQSVTKINTDNQAIVGETLFDHQGRAAVQVLPTPAFDSRLKYYELYNRPAGDNTRAYDKRDFDLDKPGAVCVPEAMPMNTALAPTGSSGSARYYSPDNPDKAGHQGYVPDAEQYPFAQVEYTPDNTGRIRRQGGVGPKYQLGEDYETKYFYGKPAQEHLNRLFGTEVGYNSHYKKNMVIDANNQVSVSYLDARGKVIATALAGDTPKNLIALESNKQKNPDPMVINLLDNKPHLPGDPVLQSTFTHLVTSAGDHEFQYGIGAERYQPECLTKACYDCVYDLVISVKDECGAEMIPGGAKKVTVGPFDANKQLELNLSCIAIDGKESFIIPLKVGNYLITKTLTVNEQALQFYLEDYLSQEECVTSLDEFIQEEFKNINFDQCDPPDCVTACLEKLGPNASPIDLQNCLLNCESPDPCQAAYEAMLADFYPGGQYAEIEMTTGSTNPPEFTYKDANSIFSPNNIFGIIYYDLNIHYLNDDGSLSLVTRLDGTVVLPNQLSISEFVKNFQPSWAKALVKYHPEYCMYEWCSDMNKESEAFDILMRNTQSYKEALALGLLNPLNLPFDINIGPKNSPVKPKGNNPLDPFFNTNSKVVGNVFLMQQYMAEYALPQPGKPAITTNLWYLAAALTICTDPDAPTGCAAQILAGNSNLVIFEPFTSTDSDCFEDRIWELFRALYLGRKLKLVEDMRYSLYKQYANLKKGEICQEILPAGKTTRFPFVYKNMETTLNLTDLFTNPGAVTNSTTIFSQAQVDQACQMQCESYAAAWMQKLQGCNPGGSAWDATNPLYNDLLKKLIEVCRAGCDEAHPMGSSTLPAGKGVPSIVPGEPDYQSFEDVLKSVMGHYGGSLSIACNADLLNMPMSYEYPYVSLTAGGNLDNCACDEILKRRKDYDQLVSKYGPLPGVANFAAYLKLATGVEVHTPERLACVCEKAYLKGSGGKPWAPANPQWTKPALDYLATSGEYVPIELMCTNCIDCPQITAEHGAYLQQLKNTYFAGGNIPPADQSLVDKMLETHLNNTFGLDLSIWEYLDFLDKCAATTATGISCGDVTIEALDLGRLLNALVNPATTGINGGISALMSEACLCLPPYGQPPTDPNTPIDPRNLPPPYLYHQTKPYTNSLIPHIDPNYSIGTGSCDHRYTFKAISGKVLTGIIHSPSDPNLNCEVHLEFVNPIFDFDHIQEIFFQSIRIDPAQTNVGWNYHFLIDVKVTIAGHLVTATLKGYTTCFPIAECAKGTQGISLCAPQTAAGQLPDPCREHLTNVAFQNAQTAYDEYIDKVRASFRTAYLNKCLTAAETFTMAFDDNEYHYTLYYYDQAGNLVKTVPPEGVELLGAKECVDNVNAGRNAGEQDIFTKHRMESRYRYNSLNQLVDQQIPDHDDIDDWGVNKVNIPGKLDIQAISFSNELEGVFIAINQSTTPPTGVFYRTTDGGDTWQALASDAVSPGDLKAVQFTSPNIGYAVGQKGTLVKTLNQGATWSISHTTALNDLVDLHFTSDLNGRVFTDKGRIFRTTDGGITWTSATTTAIDPNNAFNLRDVHFFDANLGFAVGESGGKGLIYRTLNGGTAWTQQQNVQALTLNDVQFVNTKEGLAVGQDGTLLYTLDGGVNWLDIPTALTGNLVKVQATGAGGNLKGYVLDDKGAVYLNTDILGTGAWSPQPLPVMVDIFLLMDQLGAIFYGLLSKGEVRKDINFSGKYSVILAPTGGNLNMRSISFVSNAEGYMAGKNNNAIVLYKTNPSGSSWMGVNSIFSNNNPGSGADPLKIVSNGKNANMLVADGATKKVFRGIPVNNGNTWSWASAVSDNPLYVDMEFNGSTGYLLASNGTVQKSTGFGSSWAAAPSVGVSGLLAIAIPIPAQAVVVGDKGAIFTLTNLGWKSAKSISPPPLNRIHTISSTTACAVGDGGTILRTTDQGGKWTTEPSGAGANLHAVRFLNATQGFAGGAGGALLYRNNSSWSVTASNTAADILDMTLNTAGTGFATTSGNVVLAVDANTNTCTANALTTNAALFGICAFAGTPTRFHAVGENGAIWFRNPTTLNWENQSSHTFPEPLFDLKMNGATGYAAGTRGLMFASSDAGKTWTPFPTGIKNDLFGLHFSKNGTRGILTGANGTLRYTADGGNTWANAQKPAGVNSIALHAAAFNDADTRGYVVGNNATLLTSTNYTNWTNVTPPAGTAGAHFKAVDLQDITGYVVGTNGVILKTENCANPAVGWKLLKADNGEPWPLFTTGANADLSDVHFPDRQTGYITGANGLILKTTDGGAGFEARPSLTTQTLNTLHFASPTRGFFAGNDGYLARLHDGTDRASSHFWYDQFGRLKASQNARQFAQTPKRYSYSKYDDLGRLVEAGEVAATTPPDQLIYHPNFPENWVSGSTPRYEVTRTFYDRPNPAPDIQQQFGPAGQQNLRGRVASTLYYDIYLGAGNLDYRFASHYSYDIHGNVFRLVQENRDLAPSTGQEFKVVDYRYDLVSGNVNEVRYQDGRCDAFYHRYEYDADNRITRVWTSSDALQWDRDAAYDYYDHGPLARAELGDNRVQGNDYAYNLQGWIKGVNSNVLNPKFDIGVDGLSVNAAPNGAVARDVYGYSLGYYAGDYNAIDAAHNQPGNRFYPDPNGAFGNAAKDLHNGNIRHMVTSLTDEKGNPIAPQGTAYQYDQLNRIKSMDAFASASILAKNNFTGVANNGAYHAEYAYDANGNITRLLRNGLATQTQMDNLNYHYATQGGKKVDNRLLQVRDNPNYTANYPNAKAPNTFDIDDQGAFDPSDPGTWNYAYDETGNLIRDKQEQIERIEWTVYGKVKRIVRSAGNHDKPDLEFAYDPAGNRILKLVKPRAAGKLKNQEYWTYTYYARDATGNIMAVYKRDYHYSPGSKLIQDKLRLTEHHLYGSSRLGIENRDIPVAQLDYKIAGHLPNGRFLLAFGTPMTLTSCPPGSPGPLRLAGKKQYELANHLGNVLSTITDRRLEVKAPGTSTVVDYYTAEVSSYTDYYPFGMGMPGRGFEGGGFRFGFQGQEGDDEGSGEGNSVFFKYSVSS